MSAQDSRQAGDTAEVQITPAMIDAGVRSFAHEMPEVEETMRNADSGAVVVAIYQAMSAQIEGRS